MTKLRRIPDERIEEIADKLLAGLPLTPTERRIIESPQGDFAMGQVRAALKGDRQ